MILLDFRLIDSYGALFLRGVQPFLVLRATNESVSFDRTFVRLNHADTDKMHCQKQVVIVQRRVPSVD